MPRVYRNVRVVTISDSTRDEMLRLGMTKQDVPVIHSGVDALCAPGEKSAHPTVAYVGRVEPYKRLPLLLDAFRLVLADVPGARLVIAGAGTDLDHLKGIGADLIDGGSLQITGYVTDEEKRAILRSAWCFVSPSSMEGWGIAAIEANACGTPSVAFDIPGLREAVSNGVSGILVPDGDTVAMALAIRRVLLSSEDREALSVGALAHASKFSWRSTSERFLDEIMRTIPVQDLNLMRIQETWRIVTRGGSEAEEIITI
jgi:glycosyltransferase involved in cell wall biosynthesis